MAAGPDTNLCGRVKKIRKKSLATPIIAALGHLRFCSTTSGVLSNERTIFFSHNILT
jgi:hypothetical protein